MTSQNKFVTQQNSLMGNKHGKSAVTLTKVHKKSSLKKKSRADEGTENRESIKKQKVKFEKEDKNNEIKNETNNEINENRKEDKVVSGEQNDVNCENQQNGVLEKNDAQSDASERKSELKDNVAENNAVENSADVAASVCSEESRSVQSVEKENVEEKSIKEESEKNIIMAVDSLASSLSKDILSAAFKQLQSLQEEIAAKQPKKMVRTEVNDKAGNTDHNNNIIANDGEINTQIEEEKDESNSENKFLPTDEKEIKARGTKIVAVGAETKSRHVSVRLIETEILHKYAYDLADAILNTCRVSYWLP